MRTRNNITCRFLISVAFSFACFIAGERNTFASAGVAKAEDDSVTVYSLQKFDFGTPINASSTLKPVQEEDFLVTMSSADVRRRLDSLMGRSSSQYSVMSLAATETAEEEIEYAFGEIPCQADVTPYGGRIYTIPITSPPLMDFAPQISLQYNSQAGNGLAGYGWNIAGLSSITISNKNNYYHGEVAPAHIEDTTAVYLLDGIPLVQNDDDTLAAEYPLETAKGNILVKKHKSEDGVLTHFSALYPDGSKVTFGYAHHTSPRAVYPVTQMTDRLGNQVQFDYSSVNSDYRVTQILLKHRNHNTYYGRIKFTYSSRNDYHVYYRAGQTAYQNKLLKTITTTSRDSVICTYNLTHELRDGVNMLTSLDCTNSEGEQLRPLTFAYGNYNEAPSVGTPDFELCDSALLTSYFTTSGDVKFIYNRGKFIPNTYRDGLVILPKFDTYNVTATKTSVGIFQNKTYHQYGSLYDPEQTVLIAHNMDDITYVDTGIAVGSGFQHIQNVDIDGDGIDEIVRINFDGTSTTSSTTTLRLTIYGYDEVLGKIINFDSFSCYVNGVVIEDELVSPVQRVYQIGDFVGNGKAQLLTVSVNRDPQNNARTSYLALIDLDEHSELVEAPVLSLSPEDKIFAVDIDSDSKTELCHIHADGTDIYTYRNGAFVLLRSMDVPNSSLLGESEYYITDINGDGYIDIAVEPKENFLYWSIYRYIGDIFSLVTISFPEKNDGDKFLFYDVNHDGLADLIQRSAGSTYIYLNEKGEFTYDNRITSNVAFAENTELVPCNILNYNAMSDFVTIEDAEVKLYSFSQNLSQSRLLTKSVNSLGLTTINTYHDMASSNEAYKIDSDRSYSNEDGYAKCRFPLNLLFSTSTHFSDQNAGFQEVSNMTYTYYDACINTQGLGFCGFGQVRTIDFMGTDKQERAVIETKNPEKMGVTTQIARGHRKNIGVPYDVTDYSYEYYSAKYGKLNPRLTKSIQTDTLTNLTATTLYRYDEYGYPKFTSTTSNLNDSGNCRNIKEVEYIHYTEPDKYILGVPVSIITNTGVPTVATFPDNVIKDSIGVLKPSVLDSALVIRPPVPVSYNTWIEKQTFEYNDNMLPIVCTDSVGTTITTLKKKGETRRTYDAYGNVISDMYAPYNVTEFIGKTYTYDFLGFDMLTATNELGQTTTFAGYDKFGNPSTATDYAGRVTSYAYNDWGTLLSTTFPDQTVETITSKWDDTGCYYIVKATTGKPIEVVRYDAAGREIRRETQGLGSEVLCTSMIYGLSGQIEQVSLPYKSTSEAALWATYEYDEYMRPVSYTHPSGNVTTWSYDKNSTTETRNGVSSTKTVNANGSLIKVQDAGGTISYTLRPDGQPSKITVSGGEVTKFSYDDFGRRIKITDPSAGVQTDEVVFNSDGSSVSTHANPNGTITTNFDKYGRVTKILRSGEYSTTYTYNTDGQLKEEISGNGTAKVYTYDEYGRLSTSTEVVPDNVELSKTYTYSEGNVASITYESIHGVIGTERYTYSNGHNARVDFIRKGLVTPIFVLQSQNEYGQSLAVQTGETARTYEYDAYGRPSRRTMGKIMDVSYSFDAVGNLRSRTDAIAEYRDAYRYDNLNRLVYSNGNVTKYAANGNITAMSDVGTMEYADTLKPYQTTSLTLTQNTLPAHVQNITYTCYGRPAEIWNSNKMAAFTYNASGDRVKTVVVKDGVYTLQRYYAGDRYEVDETPDGYTERLYLGGNPYSAPMVMIRSGADLNALQNAEWTMYNIGRDHLGSIIRIATYDGTAVEVNSFTEWGLQRNPKTLAIYRKGAEPVLMLGRGFTGHEHIPEFGLINMNARLYDPVIRRFISPDPYVQMSDFTQSYNRYSYCLNNPLIYVDENGEYWHLIIGAVIGGVLNWAMNGCEFTWKGLGYFGIGALAGALGAGIGAGISSVIAGGVFGAGFLGTSAALTATSSFVSGMAIGAGSGSSAGFINGFGNSLLQNQNFGQSLLNGLGEGVMGGLVGGVAGGLYGGIDAVVHNRNFWHGGKVIRDVALDLPQMNQIGELDCRYETMRSLDQYYNGSCDDVASLRSNYPNAETNDRMLRQMYIDNGLVIVTQPRSENLANIIADGMANNQVFIYEMRLDNIWGHSTAISRIKIFDNAKLTLYLMNPSGTGGAIRHSFKDLFNLFKVFTF